MGHGVRFVSLSASFRDNVDFTSDDPDQENFGSLSKDFASRRFFKKSSPDIRDQRHQEDADDEKVEVLDKTSRRPSRINTPYWYFLQCKKLIKENKVRQLVLLSLLSLWFQCVFHSFVVPQLQEALDLFSRDMLEGERLQPEEFNYSVLIGGCGRAGQLKKAFKLYNDVGTYQSSLHESMINQCSGFL